MTSPPDEMLDAAARKRQARQPDSDGFERANLAADHTAVVGLQYGDEGKGQIVDAVAGRFDLVVRYNGGANAGHSVHLGSAAHGVEAEAGEGAKFALHLIPSGILYPQVTNVLGNGVVLDPAQILKEIDGLRQRGVTLDENLRISDRAHVVLPYHKVQDTLFDHAVAAAWEGPAPIGTTGRGIGPCYADKALRSTAIRVGDLLRPDELRVRVHRIVAVKNALLKALAEACGKGFDPFDADALHQALLDQGSRLRPHICDTTLLLQQAAAQGRRILFEGANATLLDMDHGTYPFVTSSNCSALGVHAGAGLPGRTLREVIGVCKLYISRVGGGPFPTELPDGDPVGGRIREAGQEYGTTTGRPRRCGWMDLVALKYAVELSGVSTLICTGLSVLRGLKTIKLCVGYRRRGQDLQSFPPDAGALAEVEPIYEEFEGFDAATDGCRTFNELPPRARAYIERIEQYLGRRMTMICVGRRRDQILSR